jgi:SRSO17 transposase
MSTAAYSGEDGRRDECTIEPGTIARTMTRLASFFERYKRYFVRREQRENGEAYINGRFKNIPRRTIEPLANAAGKAPDGLQKFIGAGKWQDAPIRTEMRQDVGRSLGDPRGVLVVDSSGFPKKGTESVGVQRQWCGRLGKEENCQVGQFLGYASGGSYALVDGEIYIPECWMTEERRRAGKIPRERRFMKGWQIAAGLIEKHSGELPHAWVAGDEEYGVPNEFRDSINGRERYVFEVKTNTRFWLSDADGNKRGDLTNVAKLKEGIPDTRWRRFHVRDGEKEPLEVEAFRTWVVTPRDDQVQQRVETLLLVRKMDSSKSWQYLSNAEKGTRMSELVRAASCRHAIEELLELGKGDVGLDEYEVRSYVGWHHHLTLTLLALWFVIKEHHGISKKNSGTYDSTAPLGLGLGNAA